MRKDENRLIIILAIRLFICKYLETHMLPIIRDDYYLIHKVVIIKLLNLHLSFNSQSRELFLLYLPMLLSLLHENELFLYQSQVYIQLH